MICSVITKTLEYVNITEYSIVISREIFVKDIECSNSLGAPFLSENTVIYTV